jgi:hypothetical protein
LKGFQIVLEEPNRFVAFHGSLDATDGTKDPQNSLGHQITFEERIPEVFGAQ